MSDVVSLVPQKGAPSTSPVAIGDVAGVLSNQQATATVSEVEQNIFVAAQRGDLNYIREEIESGRAKATDRDAQNITALHWAAINANLPACQYLLEQGAEVDATGGDLMATPLQWAARNGHLYILQILISYNADPTICDQQGFNTLHLVTHSSVIMALLYILHQPIAVDSPDAQGHTSLMWAAYQGDAMSVELLLKHGASITSKDHTGLTALHWSVVRGNKVCIRKLIEAGADLNARDENGKTPREMAIELKSISAYKRALEEGGMSEDGHRKSKPLNDRNTKAAILVLPAFFFFLIFYTFSILPWFTAIPLAFAEFFGMHHIVTRVLLNHKNYTENLTHSPYFSGIILGTMWWVGYCWFTRLVKGTSGYAFTHLAFALLFLLCAYNFFRAITLDAGSCPKPASDAELKMVIEELASHGRLNGQTFCISCMARKPLRSKHCRVCDRCVARFDHHCPWVWNCVGVNNHRQFVIFVSTLVLGIVLFDYLIFAYFTEQLPTSVADQPIPCLFPEAICAATQLDAFLFTVAVWVSLQLVWTIVLLAGQLWQIARQMTTLEVTNLGRYGWMGGRGGQSLATQQGAHRHSGPDSLAAAAGGGDQDDAVITGLVPPTRNGHRHTGLLGLLMNLMGFDRFTRGKAGEGLARAATAQNPFDLGCMGNCHDFWTSGRELGVEYGALYEVPPEGFREAKRRAIREDEEDGVGRRRTGKGFIGLGILGRGRSSRDGYTPLRMDDQV